MDRILEPTPNTPLSASWARAVTRALNRLHIIGGRGVLVSQDAHGVNISLAPANPAPAPPQAWPVLCRITSYGIDGDVVQVYAAGPGAAPTSTAVLNAVEIGDMDLLPVGTWLLGFPGVAAIYEGND